MVNKNKLNIRRGVFKLLAFICGILLLGFLIPEPRVIPVAYATPADWNPNTFWFEPWGRSGVHKGMDIFAKSGTKVIASTHLFVLHRGEAKRGGKIILAIGPKWRFHYFAHLKSIDDTKGLFVSAGEPIGEVGSTGNAKGKPPHLHYSIVSLLPMFWRMDTSTQGYKKAFFLNPIDYLM